MVVKRTAMGKQLRFFFAMFSTSVEGMNWETIKSALPSTWINCVGHQFSFLKRGLCKTSCKGDLIINLTSQGGNGWDELHGSSNNKTI